MIKQTLPTHWTLQAAGNTASVPDAIRDAICNREVPATVPGCVHIDLLAAGLIPDPYLDRNELSLQWIGETDWRYTCTFQVSAETLKQQHVELVCEGLDTVAALELNGVPLGETVNMHRAYRFDAKPLLREGANGLRVTFRSALRYAKGLRETLGDLPNAYPTPFNFIRKMACNFGWDWGPTLITAGVWQPVYLEVWNTARIASVRPLITLPSAGKATVALHLALDWGEKAGEPLELSARLPRPEKRRDAGDGGSIEVTPGQRQAVLSFDVDDPALWWPRGHGEQPRYSLEVALAALDTRSLRIGFRSVELDTSADEVGSSFTLKVNGKPIFCKGANWIPDDAFPTRMSETRYRERLEQAATANMNMLRVWGGGLYESEAFYSLCDEMGLLVWQDFLFACAAYPEEAPFWSEVEAEARYQVTRLSKHPSLVLWNGNNENIWGYFDWDWQRHIGERSWGKDYYLALLPNVVAELDPTRPYWPGSPYSGAFGIHPNDDRHGPKHIWDVWNDRDYSAYRDYAPRFVAEFGFQAPPTYATIREAISDTPLASETANMRHHQKAVEGQKKLQAGLEAHFSAPQNFDDWLYLTQLNQARALEFGVTHFRALAPHCMGTVYWQLNDLWPVTSWAAVDGYGRPKPLWYATRRFFAGRLLTIQPRDGKLVLFACNDSDTLWEDELRLERLSFAGEVRVFEVVALSVAARTTAAVLELGPALSQPEQPGEELIAAHASEARELWFFARDKDLDYAEPRFDAALSREGTRHRLTLTAKTLLRDVCIFADRLDPKAKVSDQLVTLLPGESFTFRIDAGTLLTHEALISAPVFACANRFGAAPKPEEKPATSTIGIAGA